MADIGPIIDDVVNRGPSQGQKEEESNTVRMVEKLLAKAKRARAAYDSKWTEDWNFYLGKHWLERRPSYRHSEVLHYLYAEVQNLLVLLTDNRPNIEFLPEDPTDLEFSEMVSNVLRAKWDRESWAYTVAEAIVDASAIGTAFGCVAYKEELDEGLGDFSFETESPFFCYPDPNARSKINDEYCDYFITAIPTDLGKVKAKYPEKASEISADVSDLDNAPMGNNPAAHDLILKSPTDNRVITDQMGRNNAEQPDQVLLITCYMRSNETIEEELIETNELGQETKKYQTKKKYPNGRRIVIASGKVLEDVENPYRGGKFPYARLVDYILPRTMWGDSEVKLLKSPSQIIDKIISYVLDVLALTGNPVWVVDIESGVDDALITNQPGLKIVKRKGGDVRREMGAPVPDYVLRVFEYFTERVLSKIGPTSEVSRGVAPSGNSSGYAIEQLQEAAQTKVRGKARNLEVFLKEVGELMLDRILQYYSVPRLVRLTNDTGATKYFSFSISDVEDESGEVNKMATVQEYRQDPITGGYVPTDPKEMLLKSALDVKISIGTSLPFAKAQKASIAERLYDKQIIDEEEFLNQIEYPNREKIIERLKERIQAQQGGIDATTGSEPATAGPSPTAAGPATGI